jgi:DNA repair photolyase
MHLISASRRTDLPAFYADWFIQRLRSGSASWVNPFNGAVSTVSLAAQDVAAIVFWTRNFSPMLRHLDELEARGYRYLIHFTLTALPRIYETHVPSVRSAVRQMRALAERIGPERVLWRYDPILISRESDFAFHRRNFEALARDLEGATRQCSVSFLQVYGKVRRNFTKRNLPLPNPDDAQRRELAAELAAIGARCGISVLACCNDQLLGDGVGKARCVDREQALGLWPDLRLEAAAAPTREECGCSRSFDVGAYDTCLHGCIYCYATRDRETARARHHRHQAGCATLLPVNDPSR